MPPKRKRNDDTTSSSESDVVSPRRPTATALLPEVMQNIEKLKAKRDRDRKRISDQFDAYIAKKKKDIGAHYASKAEKRSSEAEDLLTRYAEALEKRALIEKSIEDIVLNAREDLRELSIVLGAAYSGRHKQASAAIGSFASPALASAKAAGTTKPGSAPQKSVLHKYSEFGNDRDGEKTRAGNLTRGRDAKHQYGKRRKGNVFDRIFW